MRTEKDFKGQVEIPDDALYGIHSVRAAQNFPEPYPFPLIWYKSIGLVKQAFYLTYQQFYKAAVSKYETLPDTIKFIPKEKLEALIASSLEVSEGKHFSNIIVPGIQGGAGTSVHMNVNEIIANRALQLLDEKPGTYTVIDPIEHANIYQSTNDVIPSSLKVAAMFCLLDLETAINTLRNGVESLEKANRNAIRIGYTQMQAAVPSTFGKLFSSYNEALSRDWWRVSKCSERIKQINLGGSAIGTGITVPRFIIMNVSKTLRELTNLPVARSENMVDATANLDSFIEVHATIKALACNLEKMANDIRLLASDIVQEKELEIPAIQTGSSIMPGKINPVACEYVISVAHKVYANDVIVSSLSAQGCLELNAYIPVIGIHVLESLQLLTAACNSFEKNVIAGLKVHTDISEDKLYKNPSVATALVPYIGYHEASKMAVYMKEHACSIFEANEALQSLDTPMLKEILKPESLMKEGFQLDEIVNNKNKTK